MLRWNNLGILLLATIFSAFAGPADAAPVTWDVDPTQSFVRLNIPDQTVSLEGTSITARIRNQDSNSSWTDAGGRRASLDGTIETDYSDFASIEFLTGQHNLFALEETNLRPNPASFDPGATDGDNPDGQYTDTSTAAAAYGAKVRVSSLGGFFNADVAMIAFSDVFFDIASGIIPVAGDGTYAGSTSDLGIATSNLHVDGLDASLIGQVIPDILSTPVEDLTGLNTDGGVIDDLGGFDRQLTYTVTVPIMIDFEGVPLSASATGQIVAFATVIPEPSSMVLFGVATAGVAAMVVRRRKRRTQ